MQRQKISSHTGLHHGPVSSLARRQSDPVLPARYKYRVPWRAPSIPLIGSGRERSALCGCLHSQAELTHHFSFFLSWVSLLKKIVKMVR